ncbi:uncharacterized protein [Drosophila takahashii]|uniref:uncharacterized protein n=1 Tax=Drosophila takahashii TaxID=29030 RepID=UPI001CF88BCB|nr:uncharacterized protein LOC108062189 [Drosophila takahashii]
MICIPALNLFFYNCLVVYIARKVIRIIKAPLTNANGWCRIPLIGRIFGSQQPDTLDDGLEFPEFDVALWNVNLHVNFLLLLPALFQIHHFTLLVALILMWNFYVYQRLFAFYLKLVWHLWWSDLGWVYYAPLVIFGLVMNTLHLSLIIGTMKLQTKSPQDPLPQIQLESPPQQEQNSVTIGDGPER